MALTEACAAFYLCLIQAQGLDHYLRIWGPMALAIIPPLAYAWLRLKGKEIRVRVAAGILLLSATPLILWTVIAIAWGLLPSDSPVAESAPRLIDTGMRMLVVAPAVMLAAARPCCRNAAAMGRDAGSGPA